MFGLKVKIKNMPLSRDNNFIRIIFLILTGFAFLLSFYTLYYVINRPNDECSWEDTQNIVRIVSVKKGGTSDRAGMQPGDILLKIAGENATSSSRTQAVLNNQKVGTVVPYFVLRENAFIELPIEIVPFGLPPFNLTMTLIGFLFGIVGLWLVWIRPGDTQAKVLYCLFISFMLFWTLNIIPPLPAGISWFVRILKNVTFTTIPVFYAYFFLLYPKKHVLLERWWFYIVLFAPTFLILVWFFLTLVFHYPSPINFIVGTGLWGLYFAFGFFRLNYCYRKETNSRKRMQIRILHWGIALGIIPSFLKILSPFIGLPFSFVYYSIPLMGLIPISFAYAVVRHRLLDVQFIIKKSFVYALLTGMVVGFYFIMIPIFGQFLQDITKLSGTLIIILTTLFVAIVFTPVRERLQHIVDRALYRESYNYRETLKQFSRALNKLIEPDILINMVLSKICKTMQIECGYFLIGDSHFYLYTLVQGYPSQPSGQITTLHSSSVLCRRMKENKETLLLSELECKDPETDTLLLNTGGVVAVPLLIQDDLAGFLLLGRKQSETIYSMEDFELLSTLADQVAISLENGKLHQALTEQERMKHELEIARRIQLNSLPQTRPSIIGMDIYGCSLPATEVGGDYYDYFTIHGDQFGIVLGDVSGKGTSAALYQSKIQGFIHALVSSVSSPKELLSRVNRLTFENIEEKSFATLVVAFIDPPKKCVVVARAGHTAILYFKKEKNRVISWEPKGIGIALEKGDVFDQVLQEDTKILKGGDVLLFYSDGLSEAENETGEEFGEARLEIALMAHANKSAIDISEGVVATVQDFVGDRPQKDDMTLVVLKVK